MTKRPLGMRGGDVGTVSRTWLQSGPSEVCGGATTVMAHQKMGGALNHLASQAVSMTAF